ncbi:helix-turn-helix domain-containing protein [Streptosporangium sandarakinum]
MTVHPIVATLTDRTRRRRITVTGLAAMLGVSQPAVSRWQAGQRYPTWGHTVAWAQSLGMRVIVHDGRAVVADGMATVPRLTELRRQRGMTRRQVAQLRHMDISAVSRLELYAVDPALSTMDAHLRALGLGLAVVEAS